MDGRTDRLGVARGPGGVWRGGTTSSGISTRPGNTTVDASTAPTSPTVATTSEPTGGGTSPGTPPADLAYASNPAMLRAAATAERKVPGGTLVSIESQDGESRWKAEVVTGDGTSHEMTLSRHGTSVVSGPDEDSSDQVEKRRLLGSTKLDYRQVARIVAAAVPESRITELELDHYRGTTVWDADVLSRTGSEFAPRIDAQTGHVIVTRPTPG